MQKNHKKIKKKLLWDEKYFIHSERICHAALVYSGMNAKQRAIEWCLQQYLTVGLWSQFLHLLETGAPHLLIWHKVIQAFGFTTHLLITARFQTQSSCKSLSEQLDSLHSVSHWINVLGTYIHYIGSYFCNSPSSTVSVTIKFCLSVTSVYHLYSSIPLSNIICI